MDVFPRHLCLADALHRPLPADQMNAIFAEEDDYQAKKIRPPFVGRMQNASVTRADSIRATRGWSSHPQL